MEINSINLPGLFFVVDSTDHDRVGEARDELHQILKEDGLRDAHLVVYANKKDQPGAMSTAELTDKLGLKNLHKDRAWLIRATCAIDGEGLFEGLEWFSGNVPRD